MKDLKQLELRVFTSKNCIHCIKFKNDLIHILNWCKKNKLIAMNYVMEDDNKQFKIDNVQSVPTVRLYINNNYYDLDERNYNDLIKHIVKILNQNNLIQNNKIQQPSHQNQQTKQNKQNQQTKQNKQNQQTKTKYEVNAYTASWCPHCISIKKDLSLLKGWCEKQNIVFNNYDADRDKDKMTNINGYPTIKIINKQNNKEYELLHRNFNDMKNEINNFINSFGLYGGNSLNQSYSKSYSQSFSNVSYSKNGKTQNKFEGYVKECDGDKCRIYKLNNPNQLKHINNITNFDDINKLEDINDIDNGFFNAFGGYEEHYDPNVDYKLKYQKYKYKLLNLEHKL